MTNTMLYQDSLVEISNESIILKNYYFPGFKERNIAFNSIEKVEAKHPTIWNGKWRFFGTGDIRTWFPLDNARNTRDTIFVIKLKKKWVRSGFTAENSAAVQNILREIRVLA